MSFFRNLTKRDGSPRKSAYFSDLVKFCKGEPVYIKLLGPVETKEWPDGNTSTSFRFVDMADDENVVRCYCEPDDPFVEQVNTAASQGKFFLMTCTGWKDSANIIFEDTDGNPVLPGSNPPARETPPPPLNKGSDVSVMDHLATLYQRSLDAVMEALDQTPLNVTADTIADISQKLAVTAFIETNKR